MKLANNSARNIRANPKMYTEQTENKLFHKIFYLMCGVFLLSATSQLSIPLKPVPLTFQSTTVILIGILYGARQGFSVVSLYLAAAALGAPILANFSGGLQSFAGPTAGYLFGFIPAVLLGGYLAERGYTKNILLSFMTVLFSDAIILSCGVIVLAMMIGFTHAIQFGLLPFIISEPIKLIVLALIAPRITNCLGKF